MEFEIGKALEILERTPKVLRSLLDGLSADWTQHNEGPDTWSPYDVIGHLVHGEQTDWLTRTQIILNSGTSQTFEPFDRFAQFEESKGKSLKNLLDEFAEHRASNLKALRAMNISEEQLIQEGLHPAFGKVSLKQLLSAWVVHDLSHIVQVSRVMAKQYADEVGPWTAYLTVLER